jgi:tetraprenyl-beta-curcumene synthase
MRTGTMRRTVTFARAARCYWIEVFPFARRELREWRRRAEAIPEPALRRDALLALQAKSGNAEGLAAFAVLAPRAERRAVIRAVVAYQTALDYLDNVTERPVHSHADRLKLNGALEVAVDSELSLETYREEAGQRADHEYLVALVEACRSSLGGLPSYSGAVSALRRRAKLGVESQAMNHSLLLDTEEQQMASWAHAVARASGLEGELQWWEVFAAGASTPALGALAALAAEPGATEGDFLAVERAYFPWVNALNTLLDSLVDLDEDPLQQRHIERYRSPQAAAERLAAIAARARAGVCELAGAQQHELILAAMGGYYLAQPAAWLGERRVMAAAVLDALGPLARSTLTVHRLRQGRPGTALRARRRRLSADALAS